MTKKIKTEDGSFTIEDWQELECYIILDRKLLAGMLEIVERRQCPMALDFWRHYMAIVGTHPETFSILDKSNKVFLTKDDEIQIQLSDSAGDYLYEQVEKGHEKVFISVIKEWDEYEDEYDGENRRRIAIHCYSGTLPKIEFRHRCSIDCSYMFGDYGASLVKMTELTRDGEDSFKAEHIRNLKTLNIEKYGSDLRDIIHCASIESALLDIAEFHEKICADQEGFERIGGSLHPKPGKRYERAYKDYEKVEKILRFLQQRGYKNIYVNDGTGVYLNGFSWDGKYIYPALLINRSR